MNETHTFPTSVFDALKNIRRPYAGRLPQNYLAYAWARMVRQAMVDTITGNTENDATIMDTCLTLQEKCFPKLRELGATPITIPVRNVYTGEMTTAEGLLYQDFLFTPLWDNCAGPEYYQYIEAYYERVLLEAPNSFYYKNPNDYLSFSMACKLVADFGQYGREEGFENAPINARLNQILNIRHEEKLTLSYFLKTDYREKQLLLPILQKNTMLAPIDAPILLDNLDIRERLEELAGAQLRREYGRVSDVSVTFSPKLYEFLELVSDLQPAGVMIEGENIPVPGYLHPDGRTFTEIELIHMADAQSVKISFNYLVGTGYDHYPYGDGYVEEETEEWSCDVKETTLEKLHFDLSEVLSPHTPACQREETAESLLR